MRMLTSGAPQPSARSHPTLSYRLSIQDRQARNCTRLLTSIAQATGIFYLGIPRALARINNAGATSINFRGSDGRSRYNALIASIDSSKLRNMGLHFTARYTYSVTTRQPQQHLQRRHKRQLQPGLSRSIQQGSGLWLLRIRHSSPVNHQLELGDPPREGRKGFLNHALNGWELTGIFSARTGAPFTVFDCTLCLQCLQPRNTERPCELQWRCQSSFSRHD